MSLSEGNQGSDHTDTDNANEIHDEEAANHNNRNSGEARNQQPQLDPHNNENLPPILRSLDQFCQCQFHTGSTCKRDMQW